jgi:hypothetical protein
MNLTLVYPLVLLAALSVEVPSLIFHDPKEDPKTARREWGGSAIPLRKGEKLVMYGTLSRANSVIVVVRSPYDSVVRELRSTIVRKIGILAEGEATGNGKCVFPEREETLGPGARPTPSALQVTSR